MDESLVAISPYAVCDPLTGEMIELKDPNVPVLSKIDAAKWLLDKVQFEIDECSDRKRRWSDKKERLEDFKTEVKQLLMSFMREEGVRNCKTPEHTAYLSKRTAKSFRAFEPHTDDADNIVFEVVVRASAAELKSLGIFELSNSKVKEIGVPCENENEFLTIK